jgi:hypothetical protein
MRRLKVNNNKIAKVRGLGGEIIEAVQHAPLWLERSRVARPMTIPFYD